MKEDVLAALGTGDNTVFVVDVSSFIFRAHYSIGYLSTGDGRPTGAVFGVANMLVSLVSDYEPNHVAIAMDSKTPTFRSDLFPDYKANRPPPPEDLKAQFPIVEELVNAFGFCVLQKDGFEADDIIATVVKEALALDYRVVVVSGDKDLQQLVGPSVIMLDTMRRKVWDADAVEKRWGVGPKMVGDLLALAGDSSDNIPGVPRIGPKTAAPLLAAYGGLDGLYANLSNIRSRGTAARLEKHREDAMISRQLVTLNEDVPIDVSIEAMAYVGPRQEALAPLLLTLEFTKLHERLFPGIDPGTSRQDAAADVAVTYSVIQTEDALEQVVAQIRKTGRFAVDLETTSVDPVVADIVGVALSVVPFSGVYVPVAHNKGNTVALDRVLHHLALVLEDDAIDVVVQNVKYEDIIFRRHGITMTHVSMDPMLASYLLDPGGRSHGLDALAARLLGRKLIAYQDVTQKSRTGQLLFADVSVDDATRYAAEDAEVTLALAKELAEPIQTAGLAGLLTDVEIPLARVLAGMELKGIKVDGDQLRLMSTAFAEQLTVLEAQAHELAGHAFNLGSPRQLQTILFDDLGLPRQKKTRTGYSTDFEVLETLSFLHELPRVLLAHRELSKLKNTYLDALPRLINPRTGRIHTNFNQAVTATGRLSSSTPNLQNIPIKSERGRDIRRAFVAEPGYVLVCADYSQVELRVLAHLSQDPVLVAAYNDGQDIHERTARAVFSLDDDVQVTREQRGMAKTVNFGVIYGKTAFSLARELGISRPEAQSFIDAYFHMYEGVARYLDGVVEVARDRKEAVTLLGRKRALPEITSSNYSVRQHAERMARNMPVQGTAADLMKLAMIEVDAALSASKVEAAMLLTVHDELVFEVPKNQVEAVISVVKDAMESAMTLSVPLVVDVGVGVNWGDAH